MAVARLKDYYIKEVAPALMKKFGYKSVMQIPKLEKVVINVTSGELRDNAKALESIVSDLATITGQKPVVCKAKKSVANFKLREGMNIGAKVTCARTPCTSSSTAFSTLPFPGCVTSEASTATPLTAAATTTWASKSS